MNHRLAICVLGMHRSGTSAVTGVLRLLGVELGHPLTGPHPGVNDLGYFELEKIIEIHDELLASIGSCWDDVLPLPENWWTTDAAGQHAERLRDLLRRKFAEASLWGVKDARMCRLLPLWLPLFEDIGVPPRFVHVLRAPSDVAGSLAKRDGFTADKSCYLWLSHTLNAEKMTRGYPRTFLTYEALLAAPGDAMAGVGQALGIAWPRPLNQAMGDIQQFVSPHLRHHCQDNNACAGSSGWRELANKVYPALCTLAHRPDDIAELDRFQRDFAARVSEFDPVLIEHLRQERAARLGVEAQIRHMWASPSWYLTKPLRLLQRLGRQV